MKKVTVLAMLTLAVGLTACGKKAENPSDAVVAVPEPVVAPSVDEAIVAVLRGHPNSRKICYDTNFDGYFMYYGPHLPPAAEDDGQLHGWYLVQKIAFHRAANKSWFIGLQPEENYITVYPDITGLPCKDQS